MVPFAITLVLLAPPATSRPGLLPVVGDSIQQPLPSRNESPAVAELRRKYDLDSADLRARRDARLRALESSTAPAPDIERARKLILNQYEQGQHQLDLTYSEARWAALESPAVPTLQPSTLPAINLPPATRPGN